MRRILVFLSIFLFLFAETNGQTVFSSKKIISNEISEPYIVYSADLDNDGDKDVIASSWGNKEILWYKNDGTGNFSERNTVWAIADRATSLQAVDIDNDGIEDILSACQLGDEVVWYKNDGTGNFISKHLIDSESDGPSYAYGEDLDNDGDLDVVAAFFNEGKLAWYENDGTGNFVNQTVISDSTSFVSEVFAIDFDNDNDYDILASIRGKTKLVWYKNDGTGNFGEEQIISDQGIAWSIYPVDIDGDEDVDILATFHDETTIILYANDGNGNFGNQINISNFSPHTIYPTNLDNNQHIDILSASTQDDWVSWHKGNGAGNFDDRTLIHYHLWDPRSVYASDLDNDGDMDILVAATADWATTGSSVFWFENLLNDANITAFAFQDQNNNGIYDNAEKPLRDMQITATPNPNLTFANTEGISRFYIDNGEYELSYLSHPLWELSTTPENYKITVDDNTTSTIYYFGFKPTRNLPRVEFYINNSPIRCNEEATYWLHYTNTGTTIARGKVTLEIDELMEFVSSNPAPTIIEDRKLTWNIANFYPSSENQIRLRFQMPNQEFIGKILETQASLELFNDNQEVTYSKSTQYDSEVLCSYDPNDKLFRSNLLGQSEFAYIEDTIQYTIRFQNTGNDVAFNIRIEDVLDKKLDLTTFHPITASHDYRTELNRETGLVTFYFDDIMLPDSTTNEEESHGFVMFGIASLEGIADKTELNNTASIYFDFNPAIITNTATLTLIEQVETDIEVFHSDYSIRVFPNPFSDYTTIEVGGLSDGNYQLQVMDILGRKVRELEMDNGKANLERGDLESGLYLVRVLEKNSNNILGNGKILVE